MSKSTSKTKTKTETSEVAVQLRRYVKELGITPDAAGCAASELVRRALATDNPRAFIETFAPAIAELETERKPEPEAEAPRQGPSAERKVLDAELVVPLGAIDAACYVSTHVEIRLDAGQARALRSLWHGLDQTNARLANGRPVASSADAIRWLLEEMNPEC